MKSKLTTEQMVKVLEYTLAEHQKNTEKSEIERNVFINDFKRQVQKIEQINLKPNLHDFDKMNDRLKRELDDGEKRINSAIRSFYLSPLVLGIVFIVFLSGVAMLTYSFNKIEKANEVADAKEKAIKEYFMEFLKDNPKANKSFKEWGNKK
jgi:hypothetical protein